MTELTKADLVQTGLDRLPSYWDDKPIATGLLKSLLQAFQNPLDLIFEILNGTSLEDAVGVQLDIIGKLWDCPRRSLSDLNYRAKIHQAITNSTVDSTPERIYEVMKVAANATALNLTEYSPNIYLYINVGVLDSLQELALTTKAAGVDITLAFPPIEDNKVVDTEHVWDYTNAELLVGEAVGNGTVWDAAVWDAAVWDAAVWSETPPPAYIWTTSDVTIASTAETLTGGSNASLITDTSAAAVGFASISSTLQANADEAMNFSFMLEKDTTNIAQVYLWTSATVNSADFYMNVDPQTGDYEVTLSTHTEYYSVEVADVGDYYCYFVIVRPTSDLAPTVNYTVEIRPAIRTTLGGSDDVTLTSSNTFAQVAVKTKPQSYRHLTSTSTGLRCSSLLLDKYLVIDDVGDFIIDDVSDFIEAESGYIYLNGAEPLGVPADIQLSQPCTVIR